MKIVWIINEGSPGHVSQSIGFTDILKQLYPLKTIEVFGCTTLRGWQRHLVRYCIGKKGRSIPRKWLSKIADIRVPANAEKPDLIVSSGGKSVFAAHAFASLYKVPYIFVGERKPYPCDWFHAVFSPVAAEVNENTYLIDFIPTPVTPELIAEKGQAEERTWCMIIGGKSRSYPFNDQDWAALAQGMNHLAERENIQWLLTTSRRTGAEAEKILQRELTPQVIKDAIWWATEPRRELYEFIARSEILFVTQDSITMVTEAIASGRPVITIDHPQAQYSEKSVQKSYFTSLIEKKYVQPVLVSELFNLTVPERRLNSYPGDSLKAQIQKTFAGLW